MSEKIGLITSRSPDAAISRLCLATFWWDALEHNGLNVEDFTHQPTTRYEESMRDIGGLLVGAMNVKDFAGWDRVILNGVNAVAKLGKPVFSQWALEDVGYYELGEDRTQPIELVDERTEVGQVVKGVEIVVFGNDIDIIKKRLAETSGGAEVQV